MPVTYTNLNFLTLFFKTYEIDPKTSQYPKYELLGKKRIKMAGSHLCTALLYIPTFIIRYFLMSPAMNAILTAASKVGYQFQIASNICPSANVHRYPPPSRRIPSIASRTLLRFIPFAGHVILLIKSRKKNLPTPIRVSIKIDYEPPVCRARNEC